jgi:ABC-type Fe3+-hydroxamate transport system substrate-binding protein
MPKTAQDDLQRHVTFRFPPERIICLCPSLTETLFTLGLTGQIAGRTRYCTHPASHVQRVAVVGGTKDFDIDRVRALKPDLIIAAKEENPRQAVESLADSLPVFVCDVTDYESALRTITNVGNLVDRTEQAAALVRDIRHAFAPLQPRARHKVAYLIWRDPDMAVGGGTYIDALLQKCGFDNVCRNLPGRYPEVTIESLRHLAPAWVFLSSEPFAFDESHVAELAAQVATARVIRVDGQMFGWYGSHMLAAADYLKQLVVDLDVAASP